MSLVANPLSTKIISSRLAYLTWVKISISFVIFMLHITSVSKVVFVYEKLSDPAYNTCFMFTVQ